MILDWTTNLGDAIVNQPQDVANVIQLLRAKAQEAGRLKTTKEQVVRMGPKAVSDLAGTAGVEVRAEGAVTTTLTVVECDRMRSSSSASTPPPFRPQWRQPPCCSRLCRLRGRLQCGNSMVGRTLNEMRSEPAIDLAA